MDPVADAPFSSPHAPASIPARRADFARPLVCLLGLPFDAIGLAEAVERIREAAFARRRCWVATPNLNFAIAARRDAAFRDSVLRSDLSLVDGMPLVWIARLLGLPVTERVAGSDLFEALQAHSGPPLSVYLFGGPPGAAAQAGERVNARGGGIRCVGHDEAGFGPIEAMSEPALIERINRSGAHFVIVALGAQKGQAWIGHNAARLEAPVLCHLGAVMNFAAGTVRRAPRWAQRSGLEWAWRIKEEPALWRRYAGDAVRAAGLVVTRVLPEAWAARRRGPAKGGAEPLVEIDRSGAQTVLRPGAASEAALAALRNALAECAALGSRLTIDLSRVGAVANPVAAVLLLAKGWFGERGGFEVVGAGPAAEADLRRLLCARPLLGHE
ncbi:MAG: WecB/TagA/CpsF family glycosyltransferase [Burkholderiales bacterium]|nr:WecB/TagA/CpsF family glycosyltransferase [Burkholderiales bacterium]